MHAGLEVAGQQVGGPVGLEIGEPLDSDRVVMLPLRIQSADHRRLFPRLDGSLDAAWLGRGRTYLALSLTHDPPRGLAGRSVDRALMHRVAETVAQRFLEPSPTSCWSGPSASVTTGRPDAVGKANGAAR